MALGNDAVAVRDSKTLMGDSVNHDDSTSDEPVAARRHHLALAYAQKFAPYATVVSALITLLSGCA